MGTRQSCTVLEAIFGGEGEKGGRGVTIPPPLGEPRETSLPPLLSRLSYLQDPHHDVHLVLREERVLPCMGLSVLIPS